MSSRAIRKLRKEQEEREKASNLTVDHESSDEAPQERPTRNAFNMLTEVDDEEVGSGAIMSDSDHENTTGEKDDTSQITPSRSKKKKQAQRKKKAKAKASKGEQTQNEEKNVHPQRDNPQLDEIDLALKSLSLYTKDGSPLLSTLQADDGNAQLNRLLAVESKHLNALNEMKRLFGNIVLEGENEGANANQGRRRGRGPRELDLAQALTGRHSPASQGQGLSGLALRRNFFMMGKEEWPKATSGGLGMESDDYGGYRFYHNAAYRDVQAQFETCVASMDPQRMIELLRYNRKPATSLVFTSLTFLAYHIATLLQVSEIAKQQGDHSVSGDLLERALFSFGRSVHSSFTAALSQGKARLDFRRPENREFWLAAWRYIANLGQRGTWHTAYEWARLLLSLDPEKDPYRVVLILDQLALRGGQWEHFLKLSGSSFLQHQWRDCPNIQISSALAKFKAKEAANSRVALAKAVQKYPWIFARLFAELKIEPMPKSIWGKSPRSERERFECELYVISANDLWNSPEAKSFLIEVVESVTVGALPNPKGGQLSTNEARHVLLSGNQAMISLVSSTFASLSTSASDPLPPSDNEPSYRIVVAEEDELTPHLSHGEMEDIAPSELPRGMEAQEGSLGSAEQHTDDAQGFAVVQYVLSSLLPWASPRTEDGTDSETASASQRLEEFLQFGSRILEHLSARARQLMQALRRRWSTEPPDWDMRFLANRLDVALAAHEPEDLEPINPPSVMPRRPEAEPALERDDEPFHFPPYPSDSEHSSPRIPEAEDDGEFDDEDEDRIQRWLAGKGMLRLRDFTAKYGTEEAAWSEEPDVEAEGRALVDSYAERVLKLGQQRTRTFIVNYVLRQGTNTDVRDLVIRSIQRINRSREQEVNV